MDFDAHPCSSTLLAGGPRARAGVATQDAGPLLASARCGSCAHVDVLYESPMTSHRRQHGLCVAPQCEQICGLASGAMAPLTMQVERVSLKNIYITCSERARAPRSERGATQLAPGDGAALPATAPHNGT
jgi:hypothetical protein